MLRLSVVCSILVAMILVAACDDGAGGSGTLCDQACDRIETCSPGTTCTVQSQSGTCDAAAQQIAQCIVDAACDEVNACFTSGSCGDGTCAGGETTATCAQDCPAGATCGDGTCSGGETTATCAQDCPAGATCGDGTCSGGETTATCAQDCPAGATCGDGACNGGETTASCAQDCPGAAVTTCGELCAFAPVSTKVGNCVASYMAGKGYNTAMCSTFDTNTPTGCKGCYALISVTDSDCAAAHSLCF